MWCCRRRDDPQSNVLVRVADLPSVKRFLEPRVVDLRTAVRLYDPAGPFFRTLNAALDDGPAVFLSEIRYGGDMQNLAVALANQGRLVALTYDSKHSMGEWRTKLFVGNVVKVPMFANPVPRGIYRVMPNHGFLDSLNGDYTHMIDLGGKGNVLERDDLNNNSVLVELAKPGTIIARWKSNRLPNGAMIVQYPDMGAWTDMTRRIH